MNKRFWQDSLGLVCLYLAIISGAVWLVINFRPLYLADIHLLKITADTGLTKNALMENFAALMAYLNNPFKSQLQMPDFPVSASGALHFYEVKRLFWLDYGILLVTLLPAFFWVRSLVKQKRLWQLAGSFKFALVIPPVVALMMALGFDTFFYQFHQLFFNNDAWIFDPRTDPVINALPETFFMHCFILFFLLIEGSFAVFYFVSKKSLQAK